jgi:hypothetical protein
MSVAWPGPLVVTLAGLSSHITEYNYQLLVTPPVIDSVFPLHGPTTGGTPVLLLGSRFSDAASVFFGERDASLQLTGRRVECVWRGLPDMYCLDSELRCCGGAQRWPVTWAASAPHALAHIISTLNVVSVLRMC